MDAYEVFDRHGHIAGMQYVEWQLLLMRKWARRVEGIDARFRSLYFSRMGQRKVKRHDELWHKAMAEGIRSVTFAGPDFFMAGE